MENTTIEVKIDFNKIPRGHSRHRSGAGKHGDRRTKRNRNRSIQKRKALQEQ